MPLDDPVNKHGMEIRLAGRQAKWVQQARDGELNLEDWDMEELLRGYRRDKGGKFRGRPPQVVPREVHQELAKRVRNNVAHQLLAVVDEHVKPVLLKILQGGASPDQVPELKLQAQVAQDLLDRFVVSKQEKLEITGTMKHEEIISSVTVDRSLPDEDIVDADVVDEDDDGDDDDADFVFE